MSDITETDSGLLVVSDEGSEPDENEQQFTEAIRHMSDRDLLVSVLIGQRDLQDKFVELFEKLDGYEREVRALLDPDSLRAKAGVAVKEFMADFANGGGLLSLMSGGFPG